jgi:hypothetical protein
MGRKQGVTAAAVSTAGSLLTRVVTAVGQRAVRLVDQRLGAEHVSVQWPDVEHLGTGAHEDPAHWQVMTIYRPIEELQYQLPAPLAELGDAIEVTIRQGPDSKGTEVAVRRSPSRLEDPGPAMAELRSALRLAKQLAEIGWVHEANVNRATESAPLNAPLQEAMRSVVGGERL